jgi:septal ring factor EnvC (AmiA/AmiB activator)
MKYRYLHIAVLFLLVATLFSPGCTAVRLADTHNTTLAVRSYNNWVESQKTYDQQVRASLDRIGQNINDYNRELARSQPDNKNLRANIASDRQILQDWETQSIALDAATGQFASDTSALNLSASPESKQAVEVLTQDMKIYSITMKNAQQHLVDYTTAMNSYLAPDDPDYWNDAFRIAAIDANSKAIKTIADGDDALAALSSAGKKLENLQ